MNTGILFDGHLMEGPCLAGEIFHNQRQFKGLSGFCLFDGYLMIAETEAATVKESLTVRYDENRRIAEVRQADAEEITELARIAKQLEQKKEKR
ncbi:MAG: hypothetical protein KDI50_06685 [Candidatus Competibacteraceae bacterium]|nr:hypothetical protein [Candidatus Competibacteraceae bacterium]